MWSMNDQIFKIFPQDHSQTNPPPCRRRCNLTPLQCLQCLDSHCESTIFSLSIPEIHSFIRSESDANLRNGLPCPSLLLQSKAIHCLPSLLSCLLIIAMSYIYWLPATRIAKANLHTTWRQLWWHNCKGSIMRGKPIAGNTTAFSHNWAHRYHSYLWPLSGFKVMWFLHISLNISSHEAHILCSSEFAPLSLVK